MFRSVLKSFCRDLSENSISTRGKLVEMFGKIQRKQGKIMILSRISSSSTDPDPTTRIADWESIGRSTIGSNMTDFRCLVDLWFTESV